MQVTGPYADEAGRAFVSDQPSYSAIEIYPPDLFVLSPDKEILGRLPYDATAEETYRLLVDVLEEHPELAPPNGFTEIDPGSQGPAIAQLAEIEERYNSTTPGREWWKQSVDLLFYVEHEPGEPPRFDTNKASLVPELEAWLGEHGERFPEAAPLARLLLGGARAHSGDFNGARDAWQSVIDLFPAHPLRHRAEYNLIEPGAFPCMPHPELARIPQPTIAQVGVTVPDAAVRERNVEAVRTDPRYVHDIVPGLPFVRIPAGTFTMGGTPARQPRELPTRRVTISRPFFISAWPVTRAVWRGFRPEDYPGDEAEGLAGALPAVRHSWVEMLELCEHLGQQSGRTFRLPTEAEWEYSARGGLAECDHPWGNDPPTPERCSYVYPRPVPVGCYPPNGYGLFDCVGNNFEWVADYYLTDAYSKTQSEITDPTGPTIAEVEASGLQATRTVRGGGWLGNPMCHINCRNAWRLGWPDNFRWCYLGGRIVVE